MNWGSTMSSALQLVTFLIVLCLAVAVIYMNHHRLLKEHFQDMSGVEKAFNTVLGRAPYKNEADYFGTLAKDGYTEIEFEMLLKKIVDDVKKAYKEVVERAPDGAEKSDTVSAFTTFNYLYEDVVRFVELRHGQRRATLRDSSTPSIGGVTPSMQPEAQVPPEQQVADTYMQVLRRMPTSEEIAKYIGMLNNRIIYPNDIEGMLKNTDEYKRMQQAAASQAQAAGAALVDKLYASGFVVPDPVKEKEKYAIYLDLVASFEDVMGRKPTDAELTTYFTKLVGKEMGMGELRALLQKESMDAIGQVYRTVSANLDVDNYKIYTDIITMYQSVFQRNPTDQELDRYFTRLQGRSLSLQQLRLILEGSEEYRILTKNQNNQVHGEVSRGLTERQIAYMINTEFVKVYERSPTEGETSFLRDKIVAYSMDNEMLYEYILRLRSMEGGGGLGTTMPGNGLTNGLGSATSNIIKTFEKSSFAPRSPSDGEMDSDVYSYGLTTGNSGTQAMSRQDMGGILDAPEYRGPGSKFREDDVFKIAEQVSKLLTDPSKPAGYSQYIQQRNVQTRDTLADQYKAGSKQEGDLLILPRKVTGNWTVPETHTPLSVPCGKKCRVSPLVDQTALIGTLLEDAEDTEVGSIMPKFIYKNLP